MTHLRPLKDTLIIKTLDEEKTTLSGIVIPGSAENEWTSRGVVVAAGPGRRDKAGVNPVDVLPGQTVLYQKGEGQPMDDEGTITLPETHVLATIEGDDVTPYWDKVLVRLDVEDGTSASGIVLPSTLEEGFDRGTVLAVGPGFPTMGARQTTELSVGDAVIFSQFNGVELDLGFEDSRRLFIVRENTIHAIVEEKVS